MVFSRSILTILIGFLLRFKRNPRCESGDTISIPPSLGLGSPPWRVEGEVVTEEAAERLEERLGNEGTARALVATQDPRL